VSSSTVRPLPPRTSGAAADDPFAAVSNAVVADAARAVLTAFRNEAGDAVDRSEVRAVLVDLAERVARPQDENGDEGLVRVPGAPLARRLLELFRAQLIETWLAAPPAAPDEILRTLQGVERVRREQEPDWAEYFASRLTGPDALELVVEVAHDLRSPLTSILFLAETLLHGQSGPVNAIQYRQLGLIYGAALGLSSIASDVMELARGGDRLVDRQVVPFSVLEIMESVQDIVCPIAEEKSLALEIHPPDTHQRLGHPLALSRVLLNLTTNALKFTDSGRVEIHARPTAIDRIEFAVRDTGRGISGEALESLFQPFRRTRARNEYCFSGTGLGLAICNKLVKAMNSELQIDTALNKGTRFFFELELPPVDPV
jgi:signal transduction histidine kinase